MLHFSFIYPGALWLLLVLVPLWVLTLTVPRRLPPWRFWGSLGLRTLLILCLIFSLAGMQLVYGVRNITTVFLLDSSDSVSPSAYAQAEQFIQEALRAMGSQDRAAVVVFGENAWWNVRPMLHASLGALRRYRLSVVLTSRKRSSLAWRFFPPTRRNGWCCSVTVARTWAML